MNCEQIMKQVVECVGPDDLVRDAAERMRDENIGFLPVCDDDRRALGTITDRDITVRVVADDRPNSTRIEEVMTREVVACRATDDISVAQELMGHHQKSRIICTDEDGRLVGVISLSDIAQDNGGEAVRTLREVTGREARA